MAKKVKKNEKKKIKKKDDEKNKTQSIESNKSNNNMNESINEDDEIKFKGISKAIENELSQNMIGEEIIKDKGNIISCKKYKIFKITQVIQFTNIYKIII